MQDWLTAVPESTPLKQVLVSVVHEVPYGGLGFKYAVTLDVFAIWPPQGILQGAGSAIA